MKSISPKSDFDKSRRFWGPKAYKKVHRPQCQCFCETKTDTAKNTKAGQRKRRCCFGNYPIEGSACRNAREHFKKDKEKAEEEIGGGGGRRTSTGGGGTSSRRMRRWRRMTTDNLLLVVYYVLYTRSGGDDGTHAWYWKLSC